MPTVDSFNLFDPTTGGYTELKVSTKFTELKNTVILSADSSFVNIGITEFNPIEDVLEVVKNTVTLNKGTDYILNGGYLRIENPNGLWKKDAEFNFRVLKNVDRSPLPSYDPALFQDGGFTKAKFAKEIQDELNSISTIKSNLADIAVNVKQFGAIGDGIVDDTIAIQNAIDSLGIKGGTVTIPEGIYKISSIYLSKGIKLQGIVGKSILVAASDGVMITSYSTVYNRNKIQDIVLKNSTQTGVGIKIKTKNEEDGAWGGCTDVSNVTIYGFEYSIIMVQSWLCQIGNVVTQDGKNSFALLIEDIPTDGRNVQFYTFCNGNSFKNCSSKNKVAFILNGARFNNFENIGIEFAEIGVQLFKTPSNTYLVNSNNVFKNIWFETISKYIVCNYKLDETGLVIANTKDDLNNVKFENCFGVNESLPTIHVPVENDNAELIKIAYGNTYTPITKDFNTTKNMQDLSTLVETYLMSLMALDPSTQTRATGKEILSVTNKGVRAPFSFNSIVGSVVNTGVTSATPNTASFEIAYSAELAKRTNGNSNAINKTATIGLLTVDVYLYNGNRGYATYYISDSIYGKYVNMRLKQLDFESPFSALTTLNVSAVRLDSPLGNKKITVSATGNGIIAIRANIVYLPVGAMTEIQD